MQQYDNLCKKLIQNNSAYLSTENSLRKYMTMSIAFVFAGGLAPAIDWYRQRRSHTSYTMIDIVHAIIFILCSCSFYEKLGHYVCDKSQRSRRPPTDPSTNLLVPVKQVKNGSSKPRGILRK